MKLPERYEVKIKVTPSDRKEKPYWQTCYDNEPRSGWCGTCDDKVRLSKVLLGIEENIVCFD